MTDAGNGDYVRKDVFDARMDRMERLIERTSSEVRTAADGVRKDLTLLRIDVYSMKTAHMWGIICFWIILALAVSSILLKKYLTPSITAEDVRRAANEAISEQISKIRGGQAK
ncbi:MAG: hypothetical protein IJS28_06380 [Synergistaceae bacterium]|nr:hypothetical protein [Synergistaceae bacterium]